MRGLQLIYLLSLFAQRQSDIVPEDDAAYISRVQTSLCELESLHPFLDVFCSFKRLWIVRKIKELENKLEAECEQIFPQ